LNQSQAGFTEATSQAGFASSLQGEEEPYQYVSSEASPGVKIIDMSEERELQVDEAPAPG